MAPSIIGNDAVQGETFLPGQIFVFGGFAREQICIYACPWPRIQGAMMDEDTLTVAYREWRGEPHGKIAKGQPTKSDSPAALKGDCIDCLACVNVCPMGIDIRDGQQLECITCALCIDACDDIMAKIGKPRGLIDYMALTDEVREREGKPPKPIMKHILRPRTIMYTSLWSLVGAGLLFALFIRPDIDLTVAPVRNPTFVTLSDGSIRNTYEMRLRNKQGEVKTFAIGAGDANGAPIPGLAVTLEGEPGTVTVNQDATFEQRVYLTAVPASAVSNHEKVMPNCITAGTPIVAPTRIAAPSSTGSGQSVAASGRAAASASSCRTSGADPAPPLMTMRRVGAPAASCASRIWRSP